jgi:outer membrane cobalamin receptor
MAFDLELDSMNHKELHEVEVRDKSVTTINTNLPSQKITAIDIAKLNVDNVADIAKHFSGVTVKDYGGAGGQKTVAFRGLNALHTGVSYDGVMMSDAQSGMIDLGKFSSENIAEVSVFNGQPSTIFQPARMFAYSGVISISTCQPHYDSLHTFHARAVAKAGSFGMYNGSAYVSKNFNKKLGISLTSDALNAKNEYPFSYIDGKNTETRKRTNSDILSSRNTINGIYRFSTFELLSIKFNHFYSDRGLPGAIIIGTPFLNYSNQRFLENEFFSQLHYENKQNCKIQYQFSAKYSDNNLKYTDKSVKYYSISDNTLTNFYQQNELYLTGTVQYYATDNLVTSLSSDWNYNTLIATSNGINAVIGTPVRKTWLSNLAVKYISRKLTFGTNLLYSSIETSNTIENQNTLKNLTPGASISFKPLQDKEFILRSFYKNIFRIPTFSEIYYHEMFSSNLKPEKTNQYNIGILYESQAHPQRLYFKISVDAYYNNILDKITIEPHGGFSSVRNIGMVDIKGVDASFVLSKELKQKSKISLQLNYTFQRATNLTLGDPQYGDQIPYTPFHSGSSSIFYEIGHFDCAYSILYSGYRYNGQNSDYRNLLPTFVDQCVYFRFTHKWLSLKCEVNNIFDVQYQIVQYYPMPGRNLKTTLTFNL